MYGKGEPMARMLSVSASKGKRMPYGGRDKPREGTHIRMIYDMFQANKGYVILYKVCKNSNTIERLIDTYGLDIRCIRYGYWCLVGEWFGDEYRDYTTMGKDL